MRASNSGQTNALPLSVISFILICLVQFAITAPVIEQSTDIGLLEDDASGCYYNFQHYAEGDRIITNEPCLNCTCHNSMLMCFLRVCPFTKPIGQDCKIEKRTDQCCPVISCPEVPVQLLTSTTNIPSDTSVGHPENYGCTIDELFYTDGARVPSDSKKPCELCYCIRNSTTCIIQECTLHVEGCRPVYQDGVCCPVKYDCDYEENLLLETTVRPTPGLILTTTVAPDVPLECKYNNEVYNDGESLHTENPCEHCYCMRGKMVCAVQECGSPLENVGSNCRALPPQKGKCCPDVYECYNTTISQESTTPSLDEIVSTETSDEKGPVFLGQMDQEDFEDEEQVHVEDLVHDAEVIHHEESVHDEQPIQHEEKPEESVHEEKPVETTYDESVHDENPIETDHDKKPIESVHDEKPAESDHDEKPVETVDNEKPLEIVDNEKPVVSVHDEKPVELDQDEKPVESDQDEKPVESIQDEKPMESDHAEKPAGSVGDKKPLESDHDEKPVETVDNEKPVESVLDENPIHDEKPAAHEKPLQHEKPVGHEDSINDVKPVEHEETVHQENPIQPEESAHDRPVEQEKPVHVDKPIEHEVAADLEKPVDHEEKPVQHEESVQQEETILKGEEIDKPSVVHEESIHKEEPVDHDKPTIHEKPDQNDNTIHHEESVDHEEPIHHEEPTHHEQPIIEDKPYQQEDNISHDDSVHYEEPESSEEQEQSNDIPDRINVDSEQSNDSQDEIITTIRPIIVQEQESESVSIKDQVITESTHHSTSDEQEDIRTTAANVYDEVTESSETTKFPLDTNKNQHTTVRVDEDNVQYPHKDPILESEKPAIVVPDEDIFSDSEENVTKESELTTVKHSENDKVAPTESSEEEKHDEVLNENEIYKPSNHPEESSKKPEVEDEDTTIISLKKPETNNNKHKDENIDGLESQDGSSEVSDKKPIIVASIEQDDASHEDETHVNESENEHNDIPNAIHEHEISKDKDEKPEHFNDNAIPNLENYVPTGPNVISNSQEDIIYVTETTHKIHPLENGNQVTESVLHMHKDELPIKETHKDGQDDTVEENTSQEIEHEQKVESQENQTSESSTEQKPEIINEQSLESIHPVHVSEEHSDEKHEENVGTSDSEKPQESVEQEKEPSHETSDENQDNKTDKPFAHQDTEKPNEHQDAIEDDHSETNNENNSDDESDIQDRIQVIHVSPETEKPYETTDSIEDIKQTGKPSFDTTQFTSTEKIDEEKHSVTEKEDLLEHTTIYNVDDQSLEHKPDSVSEEHLDSHSDKVENDNKEQELTEEEEIINAQKEILKEKPIESHTEENIQFEGSADHSGEQQTQEVTEHENLHDDHKDDEDTVSSESTTLTSGSSEISSHETENDESLEGTKKPIVVEDNTETSLEQEIIDTQQSSHGQPKPADDKHHEESGEIYPPKIPGEGDCLVEDQTYTNNSDIPTTNPCLLSCRCISSTVECRKVSCPPPPTNLRNCMPVFSNRDSCCPTYACDGAESAVPESDSHVIEEQSTLRPDSQTTKQEYDATTIYKDDVQQVTDKIEQSTSNSQLQHDNKKVDEEPIIDFNKEPVVVDDSYEQHHIIDDNSDEKVDIMTTLRPHFESTTAEKENSLTTKDGEKESEVSKDTEINTQEPQLNHSEPEVSSDEIIEQNTSGEKLNENEAHDESSTEEEKPMDESHVDTHESEKEHGVKHEDMPHEEQQTVEIEKPTTQQSVEKTDKNEIPQIVNQDDSHHEQPSENDVPQVLSEEELHESDSQETDKHEEHADDDKSTTAQESAENPIENEVPQVIIHEDQQHIHGDHDEEVISHEIHDETPEIAPQTEEKPINNFHKVDSHETHIVVEDTPDQSENDVPQILHEEIQHHEDPTENVENLIVHISDEKLDENDISQTPSQEQDKPAEEEYKDETTEEVSHEVDEKLELETEKDTETSVKDENKEHFQIIVNEEKPLVDSNEVSLPEIEKTTQSEEIEETTEKHIPSVVTLDDGSEEHKEDTEGQAHVSDDTVHGSNEINSQTTLQQNEVVTEAHIAEEPSQKPVLVEEVHSDEISSTELITDKPVQIEGKPVHVDEKVEEKPIHFDEKVEEKPVHVDENAEDKPVHENEKVEEKPVHVDENAEDKPVHENEKVEEKPVHVDEKVEEKPIHEDEKIEEKPVHEDEKVEEKPVHFDEKVEEKPIQFDENVEEKPVHVDEKVEEKPVHEDEKVEEKPVHFDEKVEEKPVHVDEKVEEKPVHFDEKVEEKPVHEDDKVEENPENDDDSNAIPLNAHIDDKIIITVPDDSLENDISDDKQVPEKETEHQHTTGLPEDISTTHQEPELHKDVSFSEKPLVVADFEEDTTKVTLDHTESNVHKEHTTVISESASDDQKHDVTTASTKDQTTADFQEIEIATAKIPETQSHEEVTIKPEHIVTTTEDIKSVQTEKEISSTSSSIIEPIIVEDGSFENVVSDEQKTEKPSSQEFEKEPQHEQEVVTKAPVIEQNNTGIFHPEDIPKPEDVIFDTISNNEPDDHEITEDHTVDEDSKEKVTSSKPIVVPDHDSSIESTAKPEVIEDLPEEELPSQLPDRINVDDDIVQTTVSSIDNKISTEAEKEVSEIDHTSPASDLEHSSSGSPLVKPAIHDDSTAHVVPESESDQEQDHDKPEHIVPDDFDHQDTVPDYPEHGENTEYDDDYQVGGPGTCRYGGKVYVSAQQIPRNDPCDFCFCFRSDIICLQQSCPPPIPKCNEEPIRGFCCPRYECPVSMATVMNITTTTTTTTTTLPPHFLSHRYNGAARKEGCQIRGIAYKKGDVVKSASNACLTCICGGDGQMKCEPQVCSAQPMMKQIMAAAAASRRR